MLILEKQSSMSTLIAMGMTRLQIGMTFWWESIYVSTAGGVCGVVIGLALSLIQQHFGIIKALRRSLRDDNHGISRGRGMDRHTCGIPTRDDNRTRHSIHIRCLRTLQSREIMTKS